MDPDMERCTRTDITWKEKMELYIWPSRIATTAAAQGRMWQMEEGQLPTHL